MGDEVKVKITDIDFDRHRVSLSIRALLEEQKSAQDEAAAQAPAEEVVYSTAQARKLPKSRSKFETGIKAG